MPRGGEITVTTRVREGNVELVVADTGEGMPPEVAANIFQPYFTTKEKGTGLGLAISQNIIQEHGGASRWTAPRAGAPPSPSGCPYRNPPRLEHSGKRQQCRTAAPGCLWTGEGACPTFFSPCGRTGLSPMPRRLNPAAT